MSRILENVRPLSSVEVDAGVAAYLSGGLHRTPDGVLVADAVKAGELPMLSAFSDRTAYEAFVNKIHVGDWLSESACGNAKNQLVQAFVLADRVGAEARRFGIPVSVVISCDEDNDDVVFRFYVSRVDEPDWLGDITRMSEPVLCRRYT